jgi:hypothetical protein
MTLAALHARAGDGERALALLEAGLSNHLPQLLTALGRPVFDPWRSDPRFQKLRREAGLDR